MLKHGIGYGASAVLAGVLLTVALWEPSASAGQAVREIPTLTAWGKIFSVLLLGALGVAYLVWRRPVAQARAILETSPLGVSHPTAPLVDWRRYFKTLLALETLAIASVLLARLAGRPLTAMDTLGVLGSSAIVALVVHLLILARSGGGHCD